MMGATSKQPNQGHGWWSSRRKLSHYLIIGHTTHHPLASLYVHACKMYCNTCNGNDGMVLSQPKKPYNMSTSSRFLQFCDLQRPLSWLVRWLQQHWELLFSSQLQPLAFLSLQPVSPWVPPDQDTKCGVIWDIHKLTNYNTKGIHVRRGCWVCKCLTSLFMYVVLVECGCPFGTEACASLRPCGVATEVWATAAWACITRVKTFN